MVIPDWTSFRSKSAFEARLETREMPVLLARPLDRLAAAIIDVFVLLVPIFILLSAPLKRWMMASFILGSEPDFVATILLMTGMAIALLVGYQTCCHYFFGATLGKRVFDLRVRPMFADQQVSFWDHFLRSCLWIVELLMFGLPWLSIFSNAKRRPLHDRFADTVVVTRSPDGVGAPMSWERTLVRAFFAGVLVFTALSISIQIHGALDKIKMERSLASLVDRDLGDCEVVNSAVDETNTDPHHRLKIAMTLYAAGLADRSCLESEVEGEIARQIPVGPITYLAQAFVYADDAEISNSYLDEVCDTAPGTVECSMSQLVTSWSDEDWRAVEEILRSSPPGSGYMDVWAVRHFMKQAEYQNALTALDRLLSHRELAEFSMAQRTKALFNFFREPEAIAAYQQAAVALPTEQSDELGAWLCSQQLQNSCAARTSSACTHILPETLSPEIDFERPAQALSNVLALECSGEQKMDYKGFRDAVKDADWQLFFAANVKRLNEDKSGSADLYQQLLQSESAPEILRVEAARRWAEFATPKQMDRLVQNWAGFGSREGWVKIGNMLFTRLAEQKNAQLALEVARRLAGDELLSPVAIHTLASFSNEKHGSDRQPAQIKAKDQIRQLLDTMGDSE